MIGDLEGPVAVVESFEGSVIGDLEGPVAVVESFEGSVIGDLEGPVAVVESFEGSVIGDLEGPVAVVESFEGSVIGDLEGPVAVVDERGRVQTIDRRWSFEWGVGVGDRWRVAHAEVGARRYRVDDAPVYETRLRVPGGDVVHRVAVANDGLGRALVVEFENASPDAVAVALVGRAEAAESSATRASWFQYVPSAGVEPVPTRFAWFRSASGRVKSRAGRPELSATRAAVSINGKVWIQPERRAGGVVAVSGGDDPWSVIRQGPGATPATARGTEVSAGLVVALPHRQTVKFQVALDGDLPTRAASPAEIASGWRAVTANALTVDVADEDLGTAWRRILPDVVVQAGADDPRSAAEAAPILDIAGLDREADRARERVVASAEMGFLSGMDAVAALRALASRDLRIRQNSGLDELVDVLVAGAADSLDPETATLLAWALEATATAPQAAADARRLAASLDARRLAAPLGAEVVYQPLTPAAVAASRVLGALIDDSCLDRIDLLPEVPVEWFGRPVDLRGFGTLWGRVSFSVRWHGRRPAFLWERLGGRDDVELRCPGLDPSWSTSQRQGESLLAEPSWAPSG